MNTAPDSEFEKILRQRIVQLREIARVIKIGGMSERLSHLVKEPAGWAHTLIEMDRSSRRADEIRNRLKMAAGDWTSPTVGKSAYETTVVQFAHDLHGSLALLAQANPPQNIAAKLDEKADYWEEALGLTPASASSTQAKPSLAAGPAMNIVNQNAPVAVMQIGGGNYATVTQQWTMENRLVFIQALQEIETVIRSQPAPATMSRDDLLAAIKEAKEESSKDKPSSNRLTKTLSLLANAIQTGGSLVPAYNMLKAAASCVGVNLP